MYNLNLGLNAVLIAQIYECNLKNYDADRKKAEKRKYCIKYQPALWNFPDMLLFHIDQKIFFPVFLFVFS